MYKSFYQRMGKKKENNVLERPSQCPDLNPQQMLWKELKCAAQAETLKASQQLLEMCS